jgi:hypothetical protein
MGGQGPPTGVEALTRQGDPLMVASLLVDLPIGWQHGRDLPFQAGTVAL